MPKPQKDVLVAEGRTEIRDLVVEALSSGGRFRVRGCSSKLPRAVEAIEGLHPDALVFGSCIPGGDEADVLRGIRDARPRLPVVLFSPLFAPGSPAVREALALGGCTRLPCSGLRYAPGQLGKLVERSLVPWIQNVVLKPTHGGHFEAPSAEDLRYVKELVRKRTAIVLEDGRDFLVQVRLVPLVRSHDMASVSELVATLKKSDSGPLHREVVDAMLASRSAFFRDDALYRALRETVVPELIRLRVEDRKLSAWTVACGTGQDTYSLAMFLEECFPVLSSWRLDVVGSEASSNALKRAREARYDDLEVSRGVPIQMLGRFFERRGSSWLIRENLRKRVDFVRVVPVAPWPTLPEFDLVVMRNLLVYLEEGARTSIVQRLRERIRPGGIAVLGRSDPKIEDDELEPVDLGPVPCYRRIARR